MTIIFTPLVYRVYFSTIAFTSRRLTESRKISVLLGSRRTPPRPARRLGPPRLTTSHPCVAIILAAYGIA